MAEGDVVTGIPRLSELIDKKAVDKALLWLGCATPAATDLLYFHLNDHGSSERLIALYGEDLRYCHATRNDWYGMDAAGRSTKPIR
jgi:hypothetical protein